MLWLQPGLNTAAYVNANEKVGATSQGENVLFNMRIAAMASLLGMACLVNAGEVDNLVADIRNHRAANETRILDDFRDLLAMPNVSASLPDMQRNAEWISAYLSQRGFETKTVSASRAPYIIAERIVDPAGKTVLIYAHFDGQPVAAEDWDSAPFEPVLRDNTVEAGGSVLPWPEDGQAVNPEWRIFARSAGDDKAPIIALMAALDALDHAGIAPSVNIKLILDGEEEAGEDIRPA